LGNWFYFDVHENRMGHQSTQLSTWIYDPNSTANSGYCYTFVFHIHACASPL